MRPSMAHLGAERPFIRGSGAAVVVLGGECWAASAAPQPAGSGLVPAKLPGPYRGTVELSATPSERLRDDLEALTRGNLGDLYRAFRVPEVLKPLTAPLLRPFARRFAEALLQTDRRVAEVGLQRAMTETLGRFDVTLTASGTETLPATGPLLITSNHPGLSDAPALLASLSRPDLKILGAERDLWAALPSLRARLVVIDPARPQRSVGAVLAHLRAGGAVLTFPAGRIEPDPALDPAGAEASLAAWSRSVALFARLEPRTRVVPALVMGVTTPETLRHPLTLLHRNPKDKAWLAASLQVMFRRYRHNRVTVRYGPPLRHAQGEGDARFFGDLLGATRTLLGASSGATQRGRNALK